MALLLFVVPAAAIEPLNPADEAEARFREGRIAMREGDFVRACRAFFDSHRLDPEPVGPLLNLADCEERIGHLVLAQKYFAAVLRRLPKSDPRTPLALAREDGLKTRIVRVHLRIVRPQGQTVVFVDDSTILEEHGSEPLLLDPGAHTFAMRAPGSAEVRFSEMFHDGEEREVLIAPGPRRSPAEPSVSRPPRRSLAPYVFGGLGAVGLSLGAVTGLLAFDRAATFRSHCDAAGCDTEGLAASRSGSVFTATSTVAFGVGLVATGIAAYFWLFRPRS
jgi:hypothetical protein